MIKYLIILFPIIAYGSNITVQTDQKTIISFKNTYIIGFSDIHKQSLWCIYNLKSNHIDSTSKIKRTNDFRVDKTLLNSASPNDYSKSGFDKGHLCPAQDRCYDIESMSETFLMSNMSPQEPDFNRGIWKKLESKTRQYALTHDYCDIICGPVIWNRYQTLTNNVTIPHAYYKIICHDDEYICFVIPNQGSDINLSKYCVPLNFIEAITKINFDINNSSYVNKCTINTNMLSKITESK